jgi:DNA-binding NarL/FixJ family response regulator
MSSQWHAEQGQLAPWRRSGLAAPRSDSERKVGGRRNTPAAQRLAAPDMGRRHGTQHITAANPKVRVVVVTLYDDESVRNALELGRPDTS